MILQTKYVSLGLGGSLWVTQSSFTESQNTLDETLMNDQLHWIFYFARESLPPLLRSLLYHQVFDSITESSSTLFRTSFVDPLLRDTKNKSYSTPNSSYKNQVYFSCTSISAYCKNGSKEYVIILFQYFPWNTHTPYLPSSCTNFYRHITTQILTSISELIVYTNDSLYHLSPFIPWKFLLKLSWNGTCLT